MGEIGELLLEGPFLARGYLNRPDATAAAFIPAPTWLLRGDEAQSRTGRRFYRTGDLARVLEDGCICYAGRVDSQVKIKGQRLELSEVEKHITDALSTKSPDPHTIVGIKAIIVDLIQLKHSVSPQLVAFICLETTQPLGRFNWDRALSQAAEQDMNEAVETSPDTTKNFSRIVSRIEEHIRQTLPNYAVPSAFVPLTSLPPSVSGKTDKEQLRMAAMNLSLRGLKVFTSEQPEMTNGVGYPAGARAMTEDEVKLAKLWGLLFGLQDINSTANFLVLGGESLSASKCSLLPTGWRKQGTCAAPKMSNQMANNSRLKSEARCSSSRSRAGPDHEHGLAIPSPI